jgi:hypothetical protein
MYILVLALQYLCFNCQVMGSRYLYYTTMKHMSLRLLRYGSKYNASNYSNPTFRLP